MSQVLIINTGGTLNMVPSPDGLVPSPELIEQAIKASPEFKQHDLPSYEILHLNPLIDSAEITTTQWNKIIRCLHQHRHQYQGFVVLHGTDTMAFTAAILSFCLLNFGKPIIMTGAQVPLSRLRTDAKDNLLTSLLLAAEQDIQECCLCFNHQLFRGNRVTKYSATDFSAFHSPNYPVMADLANNNELLSSYLLPRHKGPYENISLTPRDMVCLRLFPGFAANTLQSIDPDRTEVVLLQAYGNGTFENNKSFIAALERLHEGGCHIVLGSQCPKARVNLELYASSKALKHLPILSSQDMTFEATVAKLYYLLSNSTLSLEAFRDKFSQNVAGELTSLHAR